MNNHTNTRIQHDALNKHRGCITVLYKYIWNRLNNKMIITTLILLFVLGQLLNAFFPHNIFHFNQILLMVMLIVQVVVIKVIENKKEEIKQCLMEKSETEVLRLFSLKVDKITCTVIGEIISCIFVTFYIVTMFVLGCLEITITGVYGGILGGMVFYIGIQAYLHYISLLYFAYGLRHIQIKNYSFYFPALTNWIRKLARELSYIEKWFLFLGLMYCVIYAINLPEETILISNNISFNSNCNVLLLVTWGGILIFFAIAFPLFTFLSRVFIKDVIYNCKCSSINKIEMKLSVLSRHATDGDLLQIERFVSLTKVISESDDYPLKYSRTIFDHAYTVTVSLITLVSPFLSIIQEIVFKN